MSTIQTRKRSARTGVMGTLLCLSLLLALAPIDAQQGKKYGKLYLKEYQAKTDDEIAIIDTLMQYEAAFNAHDLEKFVSLFIEDGVYRPCGTVAQPVASKACQDVLKYNFTAYKFETYYDPVISIEGNTATVKLLIETGNYLGDYTVWMRKVGEVWLISKNDYTNTRWKDY
jgi:ketosteroid isomerase-like protein